MLARRSVPLAVVVAGLAAAVALAADTDVQTAARVTYSSAHQVSNTENHTVGVGDFNGDGHPDYAISDPAVSVSPDVGNGRVFVILGRGAGSTQVLESLGSNGFMITGEGSAHLGTSIAAAGDVNGDGKADLLVGAPFTKVGGNTRGVAYLIFGTATPANIDVT